MTRLVYERDAAAIYRQSFATIRAEADLAARAAGPRTGRRAHDPRLRHDRPARRWWRPRPTSWPPPDAPWARAGPICCDSMMVANGITRARLPADQPGALHAPGRRASPTTPRAAGTTRSAAAVDRWRPDLTGAVAVIGNAPTALFRLLELVLDGQARPAAILGLPVGFVGAAESKQALATLDHGVPYLTVHGRRGGSAMAVAALNALASEPRMSTAAAGHLFGVGVGPGDPELMTVKAAATAAGVHRSSPTSPPSAARATPGRSSAPLVGRRQTVLRLEYPVTTEPTAADDYERLPRRLLRRRRRRASRPSSTPAATWPSCARATRSSTAATCTSTSAWPTATTRPSSPASRRSAPPPPRPARPLVSLNETLTVIPGRAGAPTSWQAALAGRRRRRRDEGRPPPGDVRDGRRRRPASSDRPSTSSGPAGRRAGPAAGRHRRRRRAVLLAGADPRGGPSPGGA